MRAHDRFDERAVRSGKLLQLTGAIGGNDVVLPTPKLRPNGNCQNEIIAIVHECLAGREAPGQEVQILVGRTGDRTVIGPNPLADRTGIEPDRNAVGADLDAADEPSQLLHDIGGSFMDARGILGADKEVHAIQCSKNDILDGLGRNPRD